MTKKRRRCKPEQIVKLLQEGQAMLAAGKSEAEVFQKLQITESTWQRWKSQFGGMKSDEAKRLRTLEIGNQRLKEMLAEAKPYKRILKTAWEGNYGARHGGARLLTTFKKPARCRSVGHVRHSVSHLAPSDTSRG